MMRAIDVGPFGELADPRVLASLAARAEDHGWDGFFVWDHINYRAPVRAVADPWVALAAVACATSRIRIGALVTPLSRRRVHKVARETVTLDWLSSGRLTFGAGLGSARNNELEPYGEVADPRERANLPGQRLHAHAGPVCPCSARVLTPECQDATACTVGPAAATGYRARAAQPPPRAHPDGAGHPRDHDREAGHLRAARLYRGRAPRRRRLPAHLHGKTPPWLIPRDVQNAGARPSAWILTKP